MIRGTVLDSHERIHPAARSVLDVVGHAQESVADHCEVVAPVIGARRGCRNARLEKSMISELNWESGLEDCGSHSVPGLR